jgi:hypothetical protein
MPGDTRPTESRRPMDTTVAHSARVHDYWLGGKDNFAADRAAGDAVMQAYPGIVMSVRANRAFLARAVRFLAAEAGIRQFLDIGTGIPAANNTHEVAQSVASGSRVVYVDYDPVVLTHARSMLHNVPNTAVIEQDLLEPDEILNDPALRSLIDFREPTAFLFLSTLHFVPDEADPAGLVAALLNPFPGGSHVAISHVTPDTVPEVNDAERLFDEATEQAHVRSRSAVMKLVSGLELIEPGLTWPPEWQPDPGDEVPANAAESYYCVVVARKPELP